MSNRLPKSVEKIISKELHNKFQSWNFTVNSYNHGNKNKIMLDVQARNYKRYERIRRVIPNSLSLSQRLINWALEIVENQISLVPVSPVEITNPHDIISAVPKIVRIDETTGSIFIEKEIKSGTEEYTQLIKLMWDRMKG